MTAAPLPPTQGPWHTRGRVHVRAPGDVRAVMRTIALALTPCVLVALYNTGYQVHVTMARLGDAAPTDWRSALLATLGVAPEPDHLPACVLHGALYLLPALAVAWLAGAAWQGLFARLRARRTEPGLGVAALVFVLLLPPAAPLGHVALGMSFGLVFARELFGGPGRGIVGVPAVGVAFLALAWPQTLHGHVLWSDLQGYAGTAVFGQLAATGPHVLDVPGRSWIEAFLGRAPGTLGSTSALACVLGGALLLRRGLLAWRIVAGTAAGALVAVGLCSLGGHALGPAAQVAWHWHLVLGAFAFGAVFLAADPTVAPLTTWGGLLTGMVIGGMVVFVRVANPLHPDGVVAAVLFGQVLAPILDHGVVWLHGVREGRRRG